MKHYPKTNYGEDATPGGLLAFLRDCRDQAKAEGRPQLVNISLDVFHIDPLAVLEAVYEDQNRHFFLENPLFDQTIAAIETVRAKTACGPDRFGQIKAWAERLLERTIYTGNTGFPYCGIHFFCCFNFFDQGQDLPGFPPAQAFVPLWQVSRKDQYSLAIANCIIEESTSLEGVAGKILGAYGRFSTFPYKSPSPVERERAHWTSQGEVGEMGVFERSVERANRAIRNGQFEKVVLGRAIDFRADGAVTPLAILDRLRNRFPTCHTFSFSAGREGTFLGATPELLVSVKKGRLRAEALAGSVARGNSVSEDAALGLSLLNNSKDAREHRVVVDGIVRRLRSLGLEPEAVDRPRLLKLANVQHLLTPIGADLAEDIHILDVVRSLHPTPAVGGAPQGAACDAIQNYESFIRGPYAGPVGWFDAHGDGEFVVGIRSGILHRDTIRLFSGSGIVRGSTPQNEKLETDLKFKAMREVMD